MLAQLALAGCAAQQKPVALPPVAQNPTEEYRPGAFVWFDLLTEDIDAARRFYGKLFDWRFETSKEAADYLVIIHGDKPIGGMAGLENQNPEAPETLWLATLSVTDVDKAAAQVRASGGKVLDGPVDVAGRGRMAVISDPDGAVLALLRAQGGDPPAMKKTAGDWIWVDLFTRDFQRAGDFYTALAGYQAYTLEEGEHHTYHLLKRHKSPVAGIVTLRWEEVKPNWLPYIGVKDVEQTIKRAKKLGGSLIIRTDNVAVLADPAGGVFGIQGPAKGGQS